MFMNSMMFVVALLCLSLVMPVNASSSQASAKRWRSKLSDSKSEETRSSLFDALNAQQWLKAARLADSAAGSQDSSLWQYQAWAYSMLGRLDLVQEMEDRGLIPYLPPRCGQEPKVSDDDLVSKVAAMSRTTQVVILQELHAVVQHRLLLQRLLPALYDSGYRYLAVEDFEALPAASARSPRRPSGFHSSREPVYGDAISTALALGYTLISYEAKFPPPAEVEPAHVQQWRDFQQAKNIRKRILMKNPQARVLVFAGTNHGQEKVTGGYTPMGLRLRQETGIDPLSIDQTICRLDKRSAAAMGAINDTGARESGYDLRVALRRPRFVARRPDWLRSLGRVDVELRDEFRVKSQPLVVEARALEESDGAPPIDRVYLADGETLPLLLPPGRFRVTVHSNRGSRSYVEVVGGGPTE